ncbi:DUF2975 domain-containing protein [Asticcacaulis sp. ZE23SCel15]|jgi:Protein of unknown function (DUF2975)|uniref:DUF2975 domain-containing protein n=1 Tax=unclassified Asticcacaulis TaxID=2628350 RepID=UPI00226CC592|nr:MULTISPECIES: DUF2975 domain-containing protein [unclassified Asticcacaulis]WAC47112.1 DUF2975 domain-containing protein [Asticcacaulis sp. SL142]WKL58500.1 DUF2975 domain-containing protein [Asticcacaulis sp. ZE23SCel15]
MRFLGPRSISSLLKTALDVVYFGLFGLIIGLVLATLSLLSVPTLATEVVTRLNVSVPLDAGSQAVLLLAFGISLGGYMIIMHWTRQVFRTLAEGDVFHPDNTRRLRWIGFGLGGLEVFGYAARFLVERAYGLHLEPVYGVRAVTTWFSVLVVFVLAEVFKEGARLRQEADLTI